MFSIVFEPPKKLNKSFYICDRKFFVDEIIEMYSANDICFGVIFFSGNGYDIYKVIKSGNFFENKKILTKNIKLPNQHKTGGQSALRFSRIRDEFIHNYITMSAEHIVSIFMSKNNTICNINGLIIAGSGQIKHKLLEHELMVKYLKNKVIDIIDTPEITSDTINDILMKAKTIFSNYDNKKYNNVLDEIKNLIATNSDILVFGIKDIIDELSMIKTVYIDTEDSNINIIKESIDKINKKCELIVIPNMRDIKIVGIKFY